MIVTNEEMALANKLALVDTDLLASILDRLGNKLIEICRQPQVINSPAVEGTLMELHEFVTNEAENLREG